MDTGERRKRSRFDQTESEPRRPTRFDRRSQSPPTRKSGAIRERSPPLGSRDSNTPDARSPPVDPTAAAAAAAAKINAELQARKGIQHVDVPPIRSSSASSPQGTGAAGGNINGEMYISDGDYIKDIEVNDLRNRYLLTKGATQKMIKEETGADITTRGNYYPDKSMATPANPPLYLHITSTTKEGLEQAVAKIEELMKQELPQLVDERRFRRREQEQVERDEFGRRKWPEDKIPITLETLPGFNLRAQVVGHGGAYVKHIQNETGCRVQIKGRGSGYVEASTGRESDEVMFLHVAGPEVSMVEKAKALCEDLLANVKEQYEEFKNRPPRIHGFGDRSGQYGERSRGYGDRSSRDGSGSFQDYGGRNGHNSSSAGPGASASPQTQSSTGATPGAADYAAQYAQYYGAGADPYAAYGGYHAYMQYYQQWLATQAGQQGAAAAAAAPGIGASASPPPPPSEAAPPPPPPPSTAAPPPPPPPA